MKKFIYATLLAIAAVSIQAAPAISLKSGEKLTGITINPTFKSQYSELKVPRVTINKIQSSLKNSPVTLMIELVPVKEVYNVEFSAKNSSDEVVASKTFKAITNKDGKKISNKKPLMHTNVNYAIDGKYTEIKALKGVSFTIPVSMTK